MPAGHLGLCRWFHMLLSLCVLLQPKLLAALASEPEQLAQRLVELKTLLPQADVASIVAQACSAGLTFAHLARVLKRHAVRLLRLSGHLFTSSYASQPVYMQLLAPHPTPLQRPSLLLDGEWERVPGGVAALAARYSEQEVARLASAEPLLLVEDLEHVLQELGRWGGRGASYQGFGQAGEGGCGLGVLVAAER